MNDIRHDLSTEETQLVHKLMDAGMSEEHATDWVKEIIAGVIDRCVSVIPNDHSCSCHRGVEGPCSFCTDLGCMIWDIKIWALSGYQGAYRMNTRTPREEFEKIFGPISDDQFEALKVFVSKHYTPSIQNLISGVRIGDKIYHPSDVKFIMRD